MQAKTIVAIVMLIALIAVLAHSLPLRQNQVSAAYFNGSSYLLLNRSITGNFTASIWLNYSEFNGTGVAVAQGMGENMHSDWYIGTGGEVGAKTTCGVFSDKLLPGNYTAGWRFAEAPFVGMHRWHNIICAYNGSYVALYIDGALVNKTATPYAIANGSIIEIGKRTSTFYINNTQTFAPFYGSLANLQIYSRQLSSQEILQIYRQGIHGSPMGNVTIYAPLPNNSDTSCIAYGLPCELRRASLKD